ncbi:MAG: hypothetical protein IJN68_04730 [Clostridia bacterium]|nr:hypothetical protein [Clostridia bacterium]
MKKTKLYAKKTLSVLMAVMMLMTAWVWVAPEKAEAAADVAPATTYATYHVKLTAEFENIGKSGHIIIYYYPVNADGTLNTTVKGEYILVNSASKYSSTTWTFDTADDSTRRLSTDTSAETGPVQGWPCGVKLGSVSNWGSSTVTLTGLTIGTKSVVKNGGNWGATGGDTKEILYDNTGSGWDGYLDWPVPAVSSVRSTPVAQTISVPKTGSASKTFTATFNDQYGVQWPSSKGMSVNLSPALSGASATISGNTATVTGNMNVFGNAGYNSSNGQIITKLNMTQGGVTASCDVTFQSPKYDVNLYYFNGNLAKTYSNIGYYNQSVTLTDTPANTKTVQIPGDNDYHQPYKWPEDISGAFNIDQDKTYTEVMAAHERHTYGDWAPVAGTGNHSRICSVCGYVQTEGHVASTTGYQTKAETCTEDGVMTYDCSVCGEKAVATSVINKITGHDFSGDIVVGTAGKDGNHQRKCVRYDQCGTYGWPGEGAGGHQDHDWDKNNDGTVNILDATSSEASTCYKEGFATYTCEVCNDTYTETLPLAEHAITATAAKDATNICGGDGNAAFWSCSVCNGVWKDKDLTDKLADTTDADSDGIPDALETKGPEHSFTGAYVSATGGENGTHYRQCARFTQCNTYGPEEKHTWGEPVVTPATCEKEGKEVYTCTSGCGQTYEKTLDKAAHSMTKIAAVAAVCGTPGNNEYYSCSTCNKYYKDEAGTTVTTVEAEKIPALNHTCTGHHEGDELVTKATCTAKAVYKNTCDYCGQEVSGTHTYGEVDRLNGHNYSGDIKADAENNKHAYLCKNGCGTYGNETDCEYVKTAETDSTCKTKGYITYECTTCENGYTTEKDLDPANHEGATEVRDAAAATCMTPGYTGDTYCLGCGKIKSAGTEIPVDKTNHENMKDYDQVNSTCQTEGYKAYRYCDKCGTYEIAKEAIAKKNHSFTEYTTNNNGTHTANCNTCKAENGEVATDTKACTGGTANCQSAAICTVCNAPYGQIDENTHVNQEFVAKTPATCQKEGHEAYYKCADCDKTIGEIETIPVIAHTFGKWTKVEGEDKHTRSCTTCKADVAEVATETLDCAGGTAYCNKLAECATCKATYGDYDPDNHSTEANTLKGAVDATCQAPGFTGNYYYDCCNALKQAGTAIEQLAHTFDIEVEGTRVAATCIAKGEVTYKCSTCVESEGVAAATQKKELAIDANNHATPNETVVKNQKAATCEEDGHTGDVYYKCCYVEGNTAEQNKKALKEKGTTIKANGQHVYGEYIPEYMAEITTDADGVKTLGKKTTEPDYDAKIKARRADNKWYHFAQCTICGVITEDACYTYKHTFNCVDTDKCEICKGLCSLKDETVHTNLVMIEGKEATHTEDGYKAYYKCADCGKFFLDDGGKKEFDPATDAGKKLITVSKDTVPCTEWEKDPYETKDPTCDEDGYKKYHCVIEGCTKVKTEIIPSAGVAHKWAADYKVIKEATCGTVGYKAIYCEVCEAMKPNSASTIPATGEHNYVLNEDKTVVGTSCSDPTIKYYECTCGAYKTETVYEGNAEHDWSEWVTIGGDCSTGVVQESVCAVCGEKKQQTISEGEHSYVVYVRVEPTPEKDGYVIYECENCKVKTEPETLKYEGPETPDNHLVDYTQYRVVSEKTCTMAEQREYTCIRCGEKLVYAFGELAEHYWLEQPAEIATCERDGHNAYYRCVVCLEERGKEVYKATGHADNDADGKCDECNSAFYNDGKNQCGCICHKEGWFMQFIYKIVNFFWKLFKINHSCACGAVHY